MTEHWYNILKQQYKCSRNIKHQHVHMLLLMQLLLHNDEAQESHHTTEVWTDTAVKIAACFHCSTWQRCRTVWTPQYTTLHLTTSCIMEILWTISTLAKYRINICTHNISLDSTLRNCCASKLSLSVVLLSDTTIRQSGSTLRMEREYLMILLILFLLVILTLLPQHTTLNRTAAKIEQKIDRR